jgi:hypothetical protein
MAFASLDDIKARAARPFTATDEAAASMLLEGAQAVIEASVEKTEEEMGASVPEILRFVAIEVVVRAMANPQGLASQSETLGVYSHTERFSGGDTVNSLILTKAEELMARRAVHGRVSGTGEAESLASDFCVLCHMAPSLLNGVWICGCSGS